MTEPTSETTSGSASQPPEVRAAWDLAARHHLHDGPPRPPPALAELGAISDWVPRALTAARAAAPENLTAAEWMLDNDYHLRRALRQIRADMTPAFLNRLRALPPQAVVTGPDQAGRRAGPPRIHAMAHGLLAASQMQLSLPVCVRFLRAYQDRAPLDIAELWAFPTMLRVAALEVLIAAVSQRFADVAPPLSPEQLAELPAGLDASECVARAMATLSVLKTIDWKLVFDASSLVEEILALDPAGVYPLMEFRSRDDYRKAIETICGSCRHSEREVAAALVTLCAGYPGDKLRGHVGWWLLGEGRHDFEARLGAHRSVMHRLRHAAGRQAGKLYAGALGLAWLGALAVPAAYLWLVSAGPVAWAAGIALALVPATVLGMTLVNWLVTLLVAPRRLPKLDFRRAIAPDCRTAIAIPALVSKPEDAKELAQALEAHRLSNPDPMLQFVLLSDHADAQARTLPQDAEVERALVAAIDGLNARYGDGRGGGPFHLLHRARLYNPAEGCWMGWERKRGKLEQLNALILSGDRDAFHCRAGETRALRRVRFVLTVDADTRLPPGSANRLVGTLAHPLNTARFDVATGQVRGGYTILQPRVEISPEAATQSLFARLYGGDTAIDIYSRAVSDVYQDLFGEGSFTGKGLYEVAPFARSLEGRVPEGRILSHDLFEGLHGRVGLTSDIVVYEGFPQGYPEQVARMHRWIRGDWQLLPWLGRRVPGPEGVKLASRFTHLGRWKLLDNLRRSLVPVSLLALVLAGWAVLPGSPWVWTALAVLVPGAHLFTDLVTGFTQGRRRGAVRSALLRAREHAGRWALAVIFLVNDAVTALDAILRTLWRLWRGQRLLEWTPAAQVAARLARRGPRSAVWAVMWPAPAVAVLAGAGLAMIAPAALPAAAGLLALWFAAPEIALAASRPAEEPEAAFDARDRAFLRRIARRSWLFFETFVRPEDNWLPPDNYQEAPQQGVAHRTSPTNIGMMLLSSLTAWRLGYLGLPELVMRTRNTLDTMDRLQSWRGHLLNWYETRHLEPLEPRYVSTVDSGNLAVSLITLGQAAQAARLEPAFSPARWDGLHDTLALLAEAMAMEDNAQLFPSGCPQVLHDMQADAARLRDQRAQWPEALARLCDALMPALEACVREAIAASETLPTASLREVQTWLERGRQHLSAMRRDLNAQQGWRMVLAQAPEGCAGRAQAVAQALPHDLPLAATSTAFATARDRLSEHGTLLEDEPSREWIDALDRALEDAAQAHAGLERALRAISARARDWAHGMDFRMLLDPSTRLFFIGYDVGVGRLDPNRYDLLASESRLASYFAIAKGDVRLEHWFQLGRPVTGDGRGLALVSWNGSMFEYLMPRLFKSSPAATLLGQSDRAAVDMQRAYGARLGVPWGISESGYAAQDPEGKYRYHAFGVPGLGVRRGLARDLVIAPYATFLALQLRPQAALANLRRLAGMGLMGRYGYFEAVDYTADRVPVGESFVPVRSYMAHHHGMGLAALGNALCDDMLVNWFQQDPHIRTVELLLSERIPWELPVEEMRAEETLPQPEDTPEAAPALHPWLPPADGRDRLLHAIANADMTARLGDGAGGSLWWHRHLLTRAIGGDVDGVGGRSLYLRDSEDGALWSLDSPADNGSTDDPRRVVLHQHMVEYHHRQNGIAMSLLIGIAPGDSIEIRRIALVNETDRPRKLSITSCAEVVLAPMEDHDRHPAFSRLFVASTHVPELGGLIFNRRGRRPEELHPALAHRMVCDDGTAKVSGYETDRRAFLGRHGTAAAPAALGDAQLGARTGWTLDPVIALQAEVTLAPHGHSEIAFVTIAGETRADAEDAARRFATLSTLDWALEAAGRQVARSVQGCGLAPSDLPQAQALLSQLLRPGPRFGGPLTDIRAAAPAQPDLWAHGISGDAPILALRVGEGRARSLTAMLLAAHKLWRNSGLRIDLVILHEGIPGYVEPVRERLVAQLRDAGSQELQGHRGGVHLVAVDPAAPGSAAAIEVVASVMLDVDNGALEAQLAGLRPDRPEPPRFAPSDVHDTAHGAGAPAQLPPPPVLMLDNGFGGFCRESGDYVIALDQAGPPPAPWANVLANPDFGTIVTEAGLGWSWALNSGENRLTPWRNDPVSDPQVEALYLRDEVSGHVWTPTPLPAGGGGAFRVRHGTGATTWHSAGQGLEQELRVCVATRDPVKLVHLRLHNRSAQPRRITATYFADWLLGAVAGRPDPFLRAAYDSAARALIARNARNPVFAGRVAFLAASHDAHSVTCSRPDFLGVEGNMASPEALQRWNLGEASDCTGDICAAYQVHLNIPPGESVEAHFVLGQGESTEDAAALAGRWREAGRVRAEFDRVREAWAARLNAVQVQTPDPALDIMVNRWLPYQTVSSRIDARAGFYQAGGAFGFRDQLQDVLSLLHGDPQIARAHILRAAAFQFEEGDVLHWWHPPEGRGVRTRCSDDLLWLPYATAAYVEATGDTSILSEEVPFLSAPPLSDQEHDRYALFESTADSWPLMEHCERALQRAHVMGADGLPLIGTGDWNDGMDRVGAKGRGQSVWLGWFLIATIRGFLDLCPAAGRDDLTTLWRERLDTLSRTVEAAGWDGAWYMRARDDEGRPWGSAKNSECRIDSISQSWAVLSGAGDEGHARRAMDAAASHLMRDDDTIVRLLDPPFEATPRDPGYIRAYPPGIRENGGQYSHAAAWLGIALAELGDGARALAVFDRLNPVRQASTPEAARRYMTEPYVMAADIGGVAPHLGRGGWSWYTGAAGWGWRLVVEHILGLRLRGGALVIRPCLPPDWDGFTARLVRGGGAIEVICEKPSGLAGGSLAFTVDGQAASSESVTFPESGKTRTVHLRITAR
ncbi:GH36-type glycosyl hydrolase domain-containing protein [Alkalilacustris brevis]|uniref:GH36-type glycosyl hydrolase domain-containing protein n=1 Tax=Alkalilacustris brevis TaxID=2026338 RepID=UPI000E0DA11F|nr:glucoamylase family protein [Alkalilacustris brevis]